jgi:hypothetical protein
MIAIVVRNPVMPVQQVDSTHSPIHCFVDFCHSYRCVCQHSSKRNCRRGTNMPGLAPHTMQQLSQARILVLACPHVARLACRLRHSSRPVICKGLPGFGASGLPKATSNEWQVPSSLLPSSSPGSAEVGTLAGVRADSALGSCSVVLPDRVVRCGNQRSLPLVANDDVCAPRRARQAAAQMAAQTAAAKALFTQCASPLAGTAALLCQSPWLASTYA